MRRLRGARLIILLFDPTIVAEEAIRGRMAAPSVVCRDRVAEQRDCLSLNDHHRPVQRLGTAGDQRERQHLPEQIDGNESSVA